MLDWRVAAGVAGAVTGFLVHNVREFGWASLAAPGTGTIPMLAVWAIAAAVWAGLPKFRPGSFWALVSLAGLNLIGGAVISVLPLGVLPFAPEQSFGHYVSHIVYGAGQVPLAGLGIARVLKRQPTS